MSVYKQIYNEKKHTLEEIILSLPKRATIIVSMAGMEPTGLLENIHRYASHFKKLVIVSCLNLGKFPFCEVPDYQDTLFNDNWFYGPSSRNAIQNGLRNVRYIPNNLHLAGTHRIIAEKEMGNHLIFWGMVAPMQEKTGYLNLGISNVYEMDVLEKADQVVFEVNKHVPWLPGETQVHIRDADFITEYDKPLPVLPAAEPSETEELIARHISGLVNDGSTLQIGIGGIPNTVAKLMHFKKDLGIHTEMFTESMVDLFEAGVITNKKKNLWTGKAVFTFALGSQRMYNWLENNPGVIVLRGNYVNDPFVISQNDNMISINTAISVDLSGQVCSESIGTRQFSGTGGQLDTHRGAVKSRGGKGIIALRATAKNGTISTITPVLSPGSGVTVPRQDIDYVITEYGIAHLMGRSIPERVKSLIKIAHPDFRNQLTGEAKKIGYL